LGFNHRTKCFHNVGNIFFEFLDCCMKFFDFGSLVFNKSGQYTMQKIGIGHFAAHHFFALLQEYNLFRIFKQNIENRVSDCDFFTDFFVEIIFLVFAFPKTPIQLQGIFYGSVRSFGGIF